MIEIVNSRNGHPVLLKNGRFMASSIDPVREAMQWLNKAQAEIHRTGASGSVILLGLGSGYQASMLCEVLGAHAVLVIEPDLEMVEAIRNIHPELRRTAIVGCRPRSREEGKLADRQIGAEWRSLIDDNQFRDFACARYTLLKNQTSIQQEPEFFKNVESLLLGRERLSFLLQLKMRPELHGVFDAAKIESILANESQGLVSVKTLQKLFSVQARVSRERRMWKLLEELVI